MKKLKYQKGDKVQFQGHPLMEPLVFEIESFMTMSGNQEMVCGEYGCFPIDSKGLSKYEKL